jgi:Flp pilus assembly protein TadB
MMSVDAQTAAMRMKASNLQRAAMLAFMLAVCVWAAWPNLQLVAVSVLAAIALGFYLFRPGRSA